jgi:deoxyribose-phosphate aldolase
VKAFETETCFENGAREFDMVINIGALKSRDYELVTRDMKEVIKAAKKSENSTVKVILETGSLTDKEKVIACKLAMKARADFVKTSTGFRSGGATIHDVKLMRETVGNSLGVKAAGGIRTLEKAMAMVNAGANRIGTSSGVAIIEGS